MSTTTDRITFTMSFNGEVYTKRPTDLDKAILSLRPEILFTDIFMTVKRGTHETIKRLTLPEGRKLFNDSDMREITINNLLIN